MLSIAHYKRNTNQNYKEVSPITNHSEWASSKKLSTINAGEGVEKREPYFTVDGNANWHSQYGEQYGDSSKTGIKLPYTWAIPLLGIYQKKTTVQKDAWTPVLVATLFTIASTWKQLRCPLTDEWIKLWYVYMMEYYLAVNRNEFESVVVRRINLEPVVQNEVSQKEKNTCINAYICNLEKQYWWIYLQGRNGDADIQNRLVGIVGEGEGRTNWESNIDIYTLSCVK